MNNLPKVVRQLCPGENGSGNPLPTDHKSNALPLCHCAQHIYTHIHVHFTSSESKKVQIISTLQYYSLNFQN